MVAIGSTYGSWTVTGPAASTPRRQSQVTCRCRCGATAVVRLDNLRRGQSPCCRTCYERSRPLTLTQQRDVEARYAWSTRIIRRFQGRWPMYRDEILSACHLGLVRAAKTFDPGRIADPERFYVFTIFRQIKADLHQLEGQRRRLDDLMR